MDYLQKDYLKYYRVVHYYVRKAYNITHHELDMILYLYSEKYFYEKDYDDFGRIVDFDVDIDRMISKGYISVYARRQRGSHVYQLTPHAQKIVQYIYRVLEGVKPIGKNRYTVKMARETADPSEKNYLFLIEKMNRYMKEKKANPDKYIPPIDY
jgi:hypothetical protein